MNRKLIGLWQEKIRPRVKKENLILMILAGILLLIISMPAGRKEGMQGRQTQSVPETEDGKAMQKQGDVKQEAPEESYRKALQEELRELLRQMDGVGEVEVMITLKESQEVIVEKDQKKMQKQTAETGAPGNERVASEVTLQQDTVMDADKNPVIVKQIYPKIEGVVVLAQGVGTGRIRADIVEAVQALLGLDAHRVKVLKLGHILSSKGIK